MSSQPQARAKKLKEILEMCGKLSAINEEVFARDADGDSLEIIQQKVNIEG
jgi:hypothetical protein